MASKEVKSIPDLAPYQSLKGRIRKFYNSAVKQEHLLYCILGTNEFGASGEVAHIRLTEDQFAVLEAAYPMSEKNNLVCSDYFPVSEAMALLAALEQV